MALIEESWITMARHDQPLDQTQPWVFLVREEVLVLIGQAQDVGHRTHFLPIHLLGNGNFWNLADAEEIHRRLPSKGASPASCHPGPPTRKPARWAACSWMLTCLP